MTKSPVGENYKPDTEIPLEYLSLVKSKDTSKLKFVANYASRYRSTITLFDYEKVYTLIFYKIADSVKKPVSQFLQISYKSSDQKSNSIYNVANENNFELSFSDDTTRQPENIKLYLTGDSVLNIENSDTLFYCYLKFGQIGWSKLPGVDLDIYIEPKNPLALFSKIPASIVFLKHNTSLYFILMSVDNGSRPLDKYLLRNLLVSEN